ncbi:SCP family extracellular subfamily protein [Cardiosporidium cionae]|uniref:SCP family extracellular subfamily protein n=1 Tax=Cardiosporidium cionae TaxID=476202 RepID=A0ABQ7J751_9APIC|nr:SCP family extracellular subfamily protein [Cardiosporidium cionae]|eukprot:KAF8819818.1 SCP family extracellular subfamily protein [Cardiosporidium cionae]
MGVFLGFFPLAFLLALTECLAATEMTNQALTKQLGTTTGADDITAACVTAHNFYRQEGLQHPLEPLSASDDITAKALSFMRQRSSENCAQFAHSQAPQLGENLYAGTGGTDCKDAVKNWYNEIVDYDFNGKYDASNFAPIGHFTAVMWNKTKKIGCARTTGCALNQIVCNYSPAGNVIAYETGYISKPFTQEQWQELSARHTASSIFPPLTSSAPPISYLRPILISATLLLFWLF